VKRSRISILVLAVLLFFGAAGHGHAQILPRGSVTITNVGNAPIKFQLRSGLSDWTEQSIASGATAKFDCRCAAFEVKIETDKNEVTRSLAIGQQYRIFWNAAEKRWDIGPSARGG
jgi:hypothetical protein